MSAPCFRSLETEFRRGENLVSFVSEEGHTVVVSLARLRKVRNVEWLLSSQPLDVRLEP